MLIADAATILCLFFALLSVLIIFLSFSGLSQTPDPFLNPTTQSKSSFSAVETILFPTAVIHASLKHGMFSFSDDHFVYNGRSGIWWTFFSQCSIWHNMVPKMQKIGTSLHFYLRSDTHFAAQMSSGAECVSRPDRDAAPKTLRTKSHSNVHTSFDKRFQICLYKSHLH